MAEEIKPGWKTTEFWLSLLAMVVGIVLASLGATLPGDHLALEIVGGIASVLGALGYTVPRGKVKAAEQIKLAAKSPEK